MERRTWALIMIIGVASLSLTTAAHVSFVNWTSLDVNGETLLYERTDEVLLVWRTHNVGVGDDVKGFITVRAPTHLDNGNQGYLAGRFLLLQGGQADAYFAGEPVEVLAMSTESFRLDTVRPAPKVVGPQSALLDWVWHYERGEGQQAERFDNFVDGLESRMALDLAHVDDDFSRPMVRDGVQRTTVPILYGLQAVAGLSILVGVVGWRARRLPRAAPVDQMERAREAMRSLHAMCIGVGVICSSLAAVILLNPNLMNETVGFYGWPTYGWQEHMALAWISAMAGGILYAGLQAIDLRRVLRQWDARPEWLDAAT